MRVLSSAIQRDGGGGGMARPADVVVAGGLGLWDREAADEEKGRLCGRIGIVGRWDVAKAGRRRWRGGIVVVVVGDGQVVPGSRVGDTGGVWRRVEMKPIGEGSDGYGVSLLVLDVRFLMDNNLGFFAVSLLHTCKGGSSSIAQCKGQSTGPRRWRAARCHHGWAMRGRWGRFWSAELPWRELHFDLGG